MKKKYLIGLAIAFSILGLVLSADAGTIVKPHTFASGTPAIAAEVNANFDTVYNEVNKVGAEIHIDSGNHYVGIGTETPHDQLELTGNLRLPGTTATTGIIKIGSNNLIHAYGTENFFAGIGAGNLTMTGNENTAIGGSALYYNSTGYGNNATGAHALGSNTTGNNNTANGVNALCSNTTGSFNTAIGAYALTTQSYDNDGTVWEANNTAVGYEALRKNQPTALDTGRNNTAVGASCLSSNITGKMNTAIGSSALIYSTEGSFNTATGVAALAYNTGNNNTATGYKALIYATSSDNTATGYYALYSNTTGTYNTATGVSALYSNTTASKNTAVGVNALYAQSYDNGGTIWDSFNTALGYEALKNNQPTAAGNGKNNTAVGASSLLSNTTGSCNTAIGYQANVSSNNLENSTAIGNGAIATASNQVRIGNDSVDTIGGKVDWSTSSDKRIKKDIKDIAHGLDLIKNLRPVSFTMKNGNDNTSFGFIAQDIEALLGDRYNVLDIGGGKERMLSLRYTQLIAPMVKAMQQQQEMIDSQRQHIADLKKLMEELKARLSRKHIVN